MKRLALAAVLLAGTALTALPAKADYHMDDFSMAPGAQTVQITSPINLAVSAGQIVLHSAADGDLTVFCLDLTDLLFKPYTFNETVYTGGNLPGLPAGGLDASQRRQIASLIAFGLTVSPDGNSDAATQLAIWKTEYGAGFSDTGLSLSLSTKVALLLADSANGGLIDCPACELHILSDAVTAPNQALAFVVVPVPAPLAGAGIPGLVAACAGLFGFNLRRRRRAAVG